MAVNPFLWYLKELLSSLTFVHCSSIIDYLFIHLSIQMLNINSWNVTFRSLMLLPREPARCHKWHHIQLPYPTRGSFWLCKQNTTCLTKEGKAKHQPHSDFTIDPTPTPTPLQATDTSEQSVMSKNSTRKRCHSYLGKWKVNKVRDNLSMSHQELRSFIIKKKYSASLN